jgi:hypothetical protein
MQDQLVIAAILAPILMRSAQLLGSVKAEFEVNLSRMCINLMNKRDLIRLLVLKFPMFEWCQKDTRMGEMS